MGVAQKNLNTSQTSSWFIDALSPVTCKIRTAIGRDRHFPRAANSSVRLLRSASTSAAFLPSTRCTDHAATNSHREAVLATSQPLGDMKSNVATPRPVTWQSQSHNRAHTVAAGVGLFKRSWWGKMPLRLVVERKLLNISQGRLELDRFA